MCRNSLLKYSPPLSYLKILILIPEAFSIKAFNSKKNSHTSDFFLRKKIHVYLEKSSIKVRRYLYPFMDVIGIGPLISECISPNMLVARFSCCHLSHTWVTRQKYSSHSVCPWGQVSSQGCHLVPDSSV